MSVPGYNHNLLHQNHPQKRRASHPRSLTLSTKPRSTTDAWELAIETLAKQLEENESCFVV